MTPFLEGLPCQNAAGPKKVARSILLAPLEYPAKSCCLKIEVPGGPNTCWHRVKVGKNTKNKIQNTQAHAKDLHMHMYLYMFLYTNIRVICHDIVALKRERKRARDGRDRVRYKDLPQLLFQTRAHICTHPYAAQGEKERCLQQCIW